MENAILPRIKNIIINEAKFGTKACRIVNFADIRTKIRSRYMDDKMTTKF